MLQQQLSYLALTSAVLFAAIHRRYLTPSWLFNIGARSANTYSTARLAAGVSMRAQTENKLNVY